MGGNFCGTRVMALLRLRVMVVRAVKRSEKPGRRSCNRHLQDTSTYRGEVEKRFSNTLSMIYVKDLLSIVISHLVLSRALLFEIVMQFEIHEPWVSPHVRGGATHFTQRLWSVTSPKLPTSAGVGMWCPEPTPVPTPVPAPVPRPVPAPTPVPVPYPPVVLPPNSL